MELTYLTTRVLTQAFHPNFVLPHVSNKYE